ncbi:MAG: NlpC/P60 family protein [Acidimicrobiales bacterium]
MLTIPKASADQISSLKAQASALAARIQTLGRQVDALSQQYDEAQIEVQALQGKVADAEHSVQVAEAGMSKARSALQQNAIEAYMNGGSSPYTSGGSAMADATNSLLRAEYIDTLATNQSDTIDQYHLAALQEQTAKADLQRQTSAAQKQAQTLAADRQSVADTASQLQSALNQDTGKIEVLVAQQQAAAEAAARREAQQRLAAQQAAQAAAAAAARSPLIRQVSDPSGSSTFASPGPPPPPGHGASGAVAAAESRVGDPYVWGAAGPSSFDCSGLVMWAYAQVGISLPHYSGAQYADTTHIPMSDLEPGDLVFPSDPGQHVAMYVGNGEIVEASTEGVPVHIVPMSSWFVLASRVA